jgi:calmodulin
MAESISAEQLHDFREAFDLLDRNGDGVVTVDDLGAALHSLGHSTPIADLEAMIREVDADGSDNIDFTEFLALMLRQIRPSEVEEELKESFKVFDRNGDGFITAPELRSLLISLGLESSPSAIRSLINQGDRDRDGKISFDEFRAIALGE